MMPGWKITSATEHGRRLADMMMALQRETRAAMKDGVPVELVLDMCQCFVVIETRSLIGDAYLKALEVILTNGATMPMPPPLKEDADA